MRIERILSEGWELKKIPPSEVLDAGLIANDRDEWLSVHSMPAQVQDILWEHHLLTDQFRSGWCKEALWIGEYDWVYRCRFHVDREDAQEYELMLEGLDTFADVYLNGTQLLLHDDFYMQEYIDITDSIRNENILLIHFHRIKDRLEQLTPDPRWGNAVMKCKMIRKPIHDFPPEKEDWGSNYQGAVPWFSPVGVYGRIILSGCSRERFTGCGVTVGVTEDYDGLISVTAEGYGREAVIEYELQLLDQGILNPESKLEGCDKNLSGAWKCVNPGDNSFKLEEELWINHPQLWYPRGYGQQQRYVCNLRLVCGGLLKEERCFKIGFRRVEMPSVLEFIINGKRIRLFGGSIDPLQGYSHCYDEVRAGRLFDMVENANMNTLRIWGEGIPQPDEFYEEADRRGILIWQEFFLGHGAYPDTDEIRKACVKEAAALIRRLVHRPSVLMWCGGNETIMGAEFVGAYPYGSDILLRDFPELVKKMDPDRYYHPNSPWGGKWSDDPREGDYHTYDCVWQYPYMEYPNFVSEHIRTAPPVKHSLEKMIHGPLWEDTYIPGDVYGNTAIMPVNWLERSHLSANGQRKSGPYWEYYDGADADSMLYRFGASYGQEIRRLGEQVRRGSKEPMEAGKRSKGYFACKLLDTWPKVYCAPIDFYQEGYIPYYALARLFRPVLLSFEKGESIRLWLVNDSDDKTEGTAVVGLYHLREERFIRKDEIAFSVNQGDAQIIFDLEIYGFFPKDCVLYAQLNENQCKVPYSIVDYVDIERHLIFPEADLQVYLNKNTLTVSSDHFVRCVEIKGVCGDDEFGFLFTDNYFDLMPGDTKEIGILGRHTYGELSVKGHYMKQAVCLHYGESK